MNRAGHHLHPLVSRHRRLLDRRDSCEQDQVPFSYGFVIRHMASNQFHVFVRSKSEQEDRELLCDLSEQDLRLKVVNSYKDGKDIYVGGRITRLADIAHITILRSEMSAKEMLNKMAADHQAEIERIKRDEGKNVIGSYRGSKSNELIGCELCANVTEQWLGEAPGGGSDWTKIKKLFHNPWVVRIGGGGLLYAIGVLTAKHWGGG